MIEMKIKYHDGPKRCCCSSISPYLLWYSEYLFQLWWEEKEIKGGGRVSFRGVGFLFYGSVRAKSVEELIVLFEGLIVLAKLGRGLPSKNPPLYRKGEDTLFP